MGRQGGGGLGVRSGGWIGIGNVEVDRYCGCWKER